VVLKQELTEPWGLLLGATSAGVAWAIGLPVTAAGAVGTLVWVTKAVTSAWGRQRRPDRRQRKGALPVDAHTAEGVWLQRAKRAAAGFSELVGSRSTGPLAERVAMMQPEVAETVQALHRLAGQATAAGRALVRIDDAALDAEAERLHATRATASGDMAAELDRSLAAIRAHREVHDRLVAARNAILTRLQSGTLGLESLVARVIELSAIAVSGPTGELAAVDQLGDELEGIRQGLAETEEVSRQALSAYQRNEPA
jgi:hypothetical protein